MSQKSRSALLLATGTLLALTRAGCISQSSPLTTQGLVPALPSLGFAPAVNVDKEHRDGEPSIAVDSKNHYYVSAPSGFVATTFNSIVDPATAQAQGPQNRQSFVWKSEDQGATWKLLTVTMPPLPPLRQGDLTFGGADTDLAVDACDTVYYTDLWLGNIGVAHSDDGGATWQGVPVTGRQPVLDRQWLAAGKDCGTLYLLYQTFYGQVYVLKSTDKGLTFPQQTLVIDCGAGSLVGVSTPGLPIAATPGCYNFDGNILYDKASDKIYFVAGEPDSKGLQVYQSKDGIAWTKTEIPMKDATDGMNLIPVLASDKAGNLYAVASIARGGSINIEFTKSTDGGKNWSAYRSVSGPEGNGTALFPWVAAGDAGKVVVTYMQAGETAKRPDDVKGEWFIDRKSVV